MSVGTGSTQVAGTTRQQIRGRQLAHSGRPQRQKLAHGGMDGDEDDCMGRV